MPTGILAAINSSLASGPGIVSGLSIVETANPGSAPSGLTATAATGGFVSPGGTTRIYYSLSGVVSGVETPLATAYVDIDNVNNSVNLSWTNLSTASYYRLYSGYRSDFLQYGILWGTSKHNSLPAGSTSFYDQYPGWTINSGPPPAGNTPWVLGLRLNVVYFVFALLPSGKYTLQTATGTYTSPGLVLAPVSDDLFTSPGQRFATLSWSAFTGAVGYRIIRYVSLYSSWDPAFNRQWDVSSSTLSLNDDFSDTTTTNAANMIDVQTLQLYDWSFAPTASASPPGATSVSVVDPYVFTLQNNSGTIQVVRFNTSAIAEKAWNLGTSGAFSGGDPVTLAIESDSSKAYYAGQNENQVHLWDLVNNVSLGVFVTGPTSQGVTINSLLNTTSGMFIGWGLSDGSAGSVKQYDSSGTLIATFTCAKRPMILSPGLDDTTFWAVLFDGTVTNFKVSDQSTVHTFAYGSYQPMAVLRFNIVAPGTVTMQSPRYWVALRRGTA
jgi:hypothetical protein